MMSNKMLHGARSVRPARPALMPPKPCTARRLHLSFHQVFPVSRHTGLNASASEAPVEEPNRRSYAFLHDFCMQIPYGIIMVLSGLVLGIKGPLAAGVLLALTGMGVLLCARSSLKNWKAGRPSTPYTLISAMATAYLTWIFGLKFKMQVVKAVVWGPLLLRPPFALFFLSATMTAFLLYNVWAGGNAPRTGKH